MPESKPAFGKKGEWWVVAQAACAVLLLMATYFGPKGLNWPENPRMLRLGFAALFGGAGLLVVASSFFTLGQSFTVVPRPRKGSSLKKAGPYTYIRHPMYLGVILLCIGVALSGRHPGGVPLVIAMAVVLDRKASVEEKFLRARYPEFADYRARTRKLFPGLY